MIDFLIARQFSFIKLKPTLYLIFFILFTEQTQFILNILKDIDNYTAQNKQYSVQSKHYPVHSRNGKEQSTQYTDNNWQ